MLTIHIQPNHLWLGMYFLYAVILTLPLAALLWLGFMGHIH